MLAWPEFSMEPEELLDAGERVVMLFCMKATGVSSGLALEPQDAMVFKVSDGKVVRIDYYNNRSEALKNVDLEE
jgi:ketosteroid isomerase-like protein